MSIDTAEGTARPVILVSYSVDADRASSEMRSILNAFAASAVDALRAAGATVKVVDASREAEAATALARTADGIVILGGEDLDPEFYGGFHRPPPDSGVDRKADAFEISMARAAYDLELPFLGVCRGMQVLNVARGGTLVPDLGAGTMHDLGDGRLATRAHDVRLHPRSTVGAIYGRDQITIRSGHHQAIDVLGAGLSVTARSDDGVVEAVEADAGRVIGVQWHPEDPEGDPDDLTRLARAFVARCAHPEPVSPAR